MNMLALVDGQPQTLPLRACSSHYLDHRREIIRRRTEFDLGKARARAHILEGLKIALDNLDAVIKTIRESADVDVARTNLMSRFDLSELQAQAILDMRLARLAALERKKIEDEYLVGHPAHRRARGHPGQPGARQPDHQGRAGRAEEEVRRRAPDARRRRLQPRDDRRGPDRRRGRRGHDLRPRLHQAPAGRHLPPPAPRRQGDHRPRHPRGGRGRAPARREHPRLGAVLHQPRARVQRQGPRHPRRQPPGQGHPDHQPAGRPGRVRRGPDGDDHAARLQGRARTSSWPPARASSRRRRSSSSSGSARRGSARSSSRDDDELAWVDVSTGEDDVIIATAQGKLARFSEGEVRAMGRDAAGRHRHPARPQGRLGRRHERRPARQRPARAERDRLRQARAADRVPAQAPRRPGRRPDLRSRAARPATSPPSSRSPRRTRSCS